MSQFAAGCSICGADLEAHRAAARPRLPHVPSVSVRPRLPLDWWLLPMAVLMALVMPILGVIVAGFAARQRDLAGERGMRNAFLAVAAVAVVILLIPGLRFGVLRALLA